MPKLSLTKRNIDRLPFSEFGQTDSFDNELKGLVLRVGRESKRFFVVVDVMDPLTRKYKKARAKIGRYGEITPEQARRTAPENMQRLRAGKPAEEEAPPTPQDLYHLCVKHKGLKHTTEAGYRVYIIGEYGKFKTWLDVPLPVLVDMLKPVVVITRYQQVLDGFRQGGCFQRLHDAPGDHQLRDGAFPSTHQPEPGQGYLGCQTLA